MDAFFRLHSEEHGGGWCFCVAWYVPTWEGWRDRTAAKNRSLLRKILKQGHYDGYLLFSGDEPMGWCQCLPRSKLPKLESTYALSPEPDVWAMTCFFIRKDARGKGWSHFFINGILEDLTQRGISRVQAFPRRMATFAADDAWTGPEAIFVKAGFIILRPHARNPILEKTLRSSVE